MPPGGNRPCPRTDCRRGGGATRRFIEFFAANIRNRNTRAAYLRAVSDFFQWCVCDTKGVSLSKELESQR